jgi:hypothetical protein
METAKHRVQENTKKHVWSILKRVTANRCIAMPTGPVSKLLVGMNTEPCVVLRKETLSSFLVAIRVAEKARP